MRFVAFVMALALAAGARADELKGTVVHVTDGDTVVVAGTGGRERIRLSGIDAPEIGQDGGVASLQSLQAMVDGKAVTVEWQKRDRYNRIVGKVIEGGRDVCLEQVRRGQAWHYKHYSNEQTSADRLSYAKAEVQARERRLGIWINGAPMAPWDYRRATR